jgi:hypothetical protein
MIGHYNPVRKAPNKKSKMRMNRESGETPHRLNQQQQLQQQEGVIKKTNEEDGWLFNG